MPHERLSFLVAGRRASGGVAFLMRRFETMSNKQSADLSRRDVLVTAGGVAAARPGAGRRDPAAGPCQGQ